MQTANAALIGAGRMGRAHAQALQSLGIRIATLCDVRADALAEFGDAFGVPASARFADYRAMFAAFPGLELVVISTTADTHCELTCAAAAAGARNILCEKPMATSVAQCERMLAACQTAGARLAINHQMRFMDQYRIVRAELDGGGLGRLASMSVVAGCFGLAMNGSHYVEAFHYLTGEWPTKVAGWFAGDPIANPRGPRFFDQSGEFRFESASGQRLILTIGRDQGHGMLAVYAAAYGHMFVDELASEAIVTARKPEHRAQPSTRYGMPWDRRTFAFEQADNVRPTVGVVRALMAGRDFPDGAAGQRIVASIAACYRSVEAGGQTVAIDDPAADANRQFEWA